MKRKNAGVPMEPGVFFVAKRAFLLSCLLAALPAAGFELPLRKGTPVFDAPEPDAAVVAVLAEDAAAEAEEGSRTAVFWSRHPLARRCETWRVALPGGLSGYASPALRVREGAVVFEGQAPPWAVRILGWGAAALLAGRPTVGFEDVKAIAPWVLNHRLLLNYQARLEKITSLDLVLRLLEKVDPAAISLPKGFSGEAEA